MNFVISGSPIVKKNTQKVVWQRGRPIVVYTKQYREWANRALMEITLQDGPDWPIDEPIILKCEFYMPSLRRVDLSALYEGIQDVLVKAGVLEDDYFKIVAGHDGSRVYLDRKNPRTEVTILNL